MATKSLYFHAIAGLCLIASPAGAATQEDVGSWLNVTAIGTIGRVAYFAEVQPRYSAKAGQIQQVLLRPAVGYVFSPSVTGYAGYAHVILPVDGAKDRNEERLFLQLNWTLKNVAGGTILSRTRLEHRRLSNGNDTGWRMREMVRYTHPIGDPKTTRALVYLEPFFALNDTDWGARSGFDQLRSFAGFEVPLPGRSTMDIGYLNQFINDPGGRSRMNHIASVTFWLRP